MDFRHGESLRKGEAQAFRFLLPFLLLSSEGRFKARPPDRLSLVQLETFIHLSVTINMSGTGLRSQVTRF